MQSTRNKLIRLLSQNTNKYISGQLLSNELNVSRNTIWKHMNQLKKDGYEIEGTNNGYRIISFPKKLSENTLKWGLETDWLGKTIIHKETIETTQTLAKKLALDGAEHGTIVIADEQVAGVGRVNRRFHSLKDKGVYLSLVVKPDILPYMAPQLTLLTATVLADVLDNVEGIKPQIKWPNDVLINGKKIAGILTEMQAEQDKILYVVIGIGININQESSDFPEDLEGIVTSVQMETNKKWDLVRFTQDFLKVFEDKYNRFIKEGFSNVKVDWENYGFKLNERLQIKSGSNEFEAVFIGIAEDGALLAKRDNQKVEKIYSGEISWF